MIFLVHPTTKQTNFEIKYYRRVTYFSSFFFYFISFYFSSCAFVSPLWIIILTPYKCGKNYVNKQSKSKRKKNESFNGVRGDKLYKILKGSYIYSIKRKHRQISKLFFMNGKQDIIQFHCLISLAGVLKGNAIDVFVCVLA